MSKDDTKSPARSNEFPAGIPYIVGNEGAERFSFYGMRQILYIYLTGLFVQFAAENTLSAEQIASSKVHATQVTHLFMAGVYLFPMIGAILADRLFGKFKVIFWVSLIYCGGHAVLAIAGRAGAEGKFGLAEMAMFAGLALVAIGSGGIKPCVSANVGDQFTAANGHLVTRIYQIFYFIINVGAFFASMLTPWLYKNYGAEVAFGIPGVLMGVATFVFWLGRRKFVRVPPKPGGMLGLTDFISSSLLASPLLVTVAVGAGVAEEIVDAAMSDKSGAVAQALWVVAQGYWPHALLSLGAFGLGILLFKKRQRRQEDSGFLSILLYTWRHRAERSAGEDRWAPARRHFGEEAAEGPPAVLRIILVFSMVSVFWALFDQHSSTWVEQARAMKLTFEAPLWLFKWFAVPATITGALFGLLWLLKWVSNSPLSRRTNLAFGGLLALWGAGAAIAQFVSGGTIEIELLPAQISAMNPLFVMIVIPLLNVCVYAPMERRGRPIPPLKRMTYGMFLSALAFATVAVLQARIEAAPIGTIHVFWQIIPYFLITIAEVLVSVTGLEFAYTQAPRTMKSTIMGFWLLCVSFGNILVAFLAPLQRLSLSTFFWMFTGIMLVAAFAFLVLASRYKGKSYLQNGVSR